MRSTRWDRRFWGSTRGRIILLLRGGSSTVNELAAALGLTDNAVRTQLISLERDGLYRASRLDNSQARDPDTLIATHLNGERIDLDHGYPCRLIAPALLQEREVEERLKPRAVGVGALVP